MKKKIVIVSSTLRINGNSLLLAEEFAKGALKAAHDVKTISLQNFNLEFCIGCLSCQKTHRCVLNDDINAILSTFLESDVLVFATPIYYYGLSGQLKTFLDRLNPLFSLDNKFKSVYLLATAADDEVSAMDGAIKGIQGWIDCFDGVSLSGVVYGTGVNAPGEIKDKVAMKEAFDLGYKL